MYVEHCGFSDNGRLMTWLPYQRNQDWSALVHDISQEELLSEQTDKYFAYWYSGPQHTVALNDQGAISSLCSHWSSSYITVFLLVEMRAKAGYTL